MSRRRNELIPVAILLISVLGGGCSLRTLAARQIGNALAAGGTTFTSDDDPELVGDALPFSLKLMESVLADAPDHGPLLLAACRGFTQYAYGWVDPAGRDDGAADGVQQNHGEVFVVLDFAVAGHVDGDRLAHRFT